MATIIHEHVETSLDGLRISWGGIWAGVLTVLGTLLFLTTLGLAVGISAADPGNTDASTLGLGAAIWSGLALLIALFVGGMAATRLGMIYDRATGAFEGALVWVLSFVAILWLASSGVQLVASGISSVFSGVTQTIGSVTGGMNDLSTGDVQQMLARLNDPRTARTISTATGIPEQEVRSSLGELAQRVETARDNPEQAAAEVRRGAEQLMSRARQQLPATAERVQNTATKTAWITFAAMLISLIAAVAGAMAGRKRAARRRIEDSAATATTIR
jgi:pyruvoyl-dependent arginine decarboxylase (PvlArgDC)